MIKLKELVKTFLPNQSMKIMVEGDEFKRFTTTNHMIDENPLFKMYSNCSVKSVEVCKDRAARGCTDRINIVIGW